MFENNTLLHQGDDIVLTDGFNFAESMFDLTEPVIPQLAGNFATPTSIINQKFKNLEKLLKLGHINARSTPKHIHEIQRVVIAYSCIFSTLRVKQRVKKVELFYVISAKFGLLSLFS